MMIVDLANDVSARIREIDRLDNIKNELSAIKSSYDILQAIKNDIECLITYITVIGEKLPIAVQESVHQQCESVLSHILNSENNFTRSFQQTDALIVAENSLQETITEIEHQWQIYVNERLREPLQLLDLVKYLPEVIVQAPLYAELKADLQYFIHKVPKHFEQLKTFEQNEQKITEMLSSIKGLDVTVKEFLQKVLDGKATMKDLTPDVHDWCRLEDREYIFQITIGR